jgi:hypothetical protein
VVDYRLKTLSTTAISSQDTDIELLAENTAAANDRVAPKTTRRNLEYDAPPRQREIQRSTDISALNPLTCPPAIGTNTRNAPRTQQNLDILSNTLH